LGGAGVDRVYFCTLEIKESHRLNMLKEGIETTKTSPRPLKKKPRTSQGTSSHWRGTTIENALHATTTVVGSNTKGTERKSRGRGDEGFLETFFANAVRPLPGGQVRQCSKTTREVGEKPQGKESTAEKKRGGGASA